MELDITKLINVAQELVHNGMMSMAAEGTIKVQELEDERGNKLTLYVTIKANPLSIKPSSEGQEKQIQDPKEYDAVGKTWSAMMKDEEPDWETIAKMKPPSKDLKGPYQGCWNQGVMVGYAQCMVSKSIPLHLRNAQQSNPESQEELWDKFWGQLYAGDKAFNEKIKEVQKQFHITRK